MMKKLESKKKIVTFALIVIAIILTIIAICNVKYYRIDDRTSKQKSFRYMNGEKAVGWIRVQGTNIDMPVIDYDKVENVSDPTYNIAWISDGNDKIIRSHNMRNVSSHPLITDKTHERFEQLLSFIYTDFIKKNQYIQYTKDGKNYLYIIYGVNFINTDKISSYAQLDKEYIKNSIKESFFELQGLDVKENDDIIVLDTCTRFYGIDKDIQFVVNARKIRKKERIKRYKVKETKKYKKIKKILNS